MTYKEIKETYSKSVEIQNIVDHWCDGIPFLYFENGELYDAFLYFSCDNVKGVFKELKRMVLVNSKTGIIRSIEGDDLHEKYSIPKYFNYIAKPLISSYNEQLKLEDEYAAARNDYLSGKAKTKISAKYKEVIKKTIPDEIFINLYKPLSVMFD